MQQYSDIYHTIVSIEDHESKKRTHMRVLQRVSNYFFFFPFFFFTPPAGLEAEIGVGTGVSDRTSPFEASTDPGSNLGADFRETGCTFCIFRMSDLFKASKRFRKTEE